MLKGRPCVARTGDAGGLGRSIWASQLLKGCAPPAEPRKHAGGAAAASPAPPLAASAPGG